MFDIYAHVHFDTCACQSHVCTFAYSGHTVFYSLFSGDLIKPPATIARVDRFY